MARPAERNYAVEAGACCRARGRARRMLAHARDGRGRALLVHRGRALCALPGQVCGADRGFPRARSQVPRVSGAHPARSPRPPCSAPQIGTHACAYTRPRCIPPVTARDCGQKAHRAPDRARRRVPGTQARTARAPLARTASRVASGTVPTARRVSWVWARQFEDDGDELVNHILRNTRRYVHLFSLAVDNLLPPPSQPVRPSASMQRAARARARRSPRRSRGFTT